MIKKIMIMASASVMLAMSACSTGSSEKESCGVDYTITKSHAPNYVVVETEDMLSYDDALKVFNELSSEYEAVQYKEEYSIGDETYMEIRNNTLFDFANDTIIKLKKNN